MPFRKKRRSHVRAASGAMIRAYTQLCMHASPRTSSFRDCMRIAIAANLFVDVLPSGSEPDTRSVRGTNTCRIAIHRPHGADMLVVIS